MAALHRLMNDPDDTGQAFQVIAALTGDSGGRIYRRFRRSAKGARLLRERPQLFEALDDTHRLLAMPEGSLGRAIGEFFDTEELSAQGLAAASESTFSGAEPAEVPEGQAFLMTRLRDQHDIFHVLTGYGRDLRGELAVLAFTAMQTRNPGVAFIPIYLLFRAGFRSDMGRLVRQGFRRGWRADWIVDEEWECLLEQPLDQLRERFKIGPPPAYEQVRSAGAPQLPDAGNDHARA
jgi:ubiquinone biosynthesis protein COQ4